MAETSKIEWTDATFNPWIGCTKVSPACDHCYAEVSTPARALGVTWGARAERRHTSAASWKQPEKWNRQHEAFFAEHGRRRRVFCASLADVFDNAVDPQWRADLFVLIRDTPNLDWLLLTKRIGNVPMMVSQIPGWLPENVWLGATICNQEEADRDIPKLIATPAPVRFLSIEPMLGAIDLLKWLDPYTCADCSFHGSYNDAGPDGCGSCGEPFGAADRCSACGADDQSAKPSCPKCGSHRSFESDAGYIFDSEKKLIDWVIVGGESGAHARPMHRDWARALRDQCAAAGVPFLFKQWGEWMPAERDGDTLTLSFAEGAPTGPQNPAWHTFDDGAMSARVGKIAAGRLLDGVTHDGFPHPDLSVDSVLP
ncbi:DUF5131 family protein [Pararobbsia silviterrae]|uniref:DUF5131 family protein n=1 Tax=Pararobbsia silviterrae TaxID=1792498 RepID=A0A494X2Y1_9BURK|nr:DUF5131 family protein [Pararobbsia silviterrae]RKP44722.1 DUF5131 family protein [Pararobbsia silviterrae]